MHIDPKGTIAHHPALMVRDCLRKLRVRMTWNLSELEKAASVQRGRGRALAKALRAEGLIEEAERGSWRITQTGQRLSSATAAKPVGRITAERVLHDFLERVDRVDRDEYFLGRVNRVVLFGSMLRPDVEVLSDVDLAVEIVPKEQNRERLEQQNRQRLEELAERGRTFQREVFRFLKSGSRVVSLANYAAEKSLILTVPHKMLLGEDEKPPRLTPAQRNPGRRSRQPRDCPF